MVAGPNAAGQGRHAVSVDELPEGSHQQPHVLQPTPKLLRLLYAKRDDLKSIVQFHRDHQHIVRRAPHLIELKGAVVGVAQRRGSNRGTATYSLHTVAGYRKRNTATGTETELTVWNCDGKVAHVSFDRDISNHDFLPEQIDNLRQRIESGRHPPLLEHEAHNAFVQLIVCWKLKQEISMDQEAHAQMAGGSQVDGQAVREAILRWKPPKQPLDDLRMSQREASQLLAGWERAQRGGGAAQSEAAGPQLRSEFESYLTAEDLRAETANASTAATTAAPHLLQRRPSIIERHPRPAEPPKAPMRSATLPSRQATARRNPKKAFGRKKSSPRAQKGNRPGNRNNKQRNFDTNSRRVGGQLPSTSGPPVGQHDGAFGMDYPQQPVSWDPNRDGSPPPVESGWPGGVDPSRLSPLSLRSMQEAMANGANPGIDHTVPDPQAEGSEPRHEGRRGSQDPERSEHLQRGGRRRHRDREADEGVPQKRSRGRSSSRRDRLRDRAHEQRQASPCKQRPTHGSSRSRSRSPRPKNHRDSVGRDGGLAARERAMGRAKPRSPPSANQSDRSNRDSEGGRRSSARPNGRSPEQLPMARAGGSTKCAAQTVPAGSGYGGSTKLLSAAQIWGRKAAKQVALEGEPSTLAGKVVEQGMYATKPGGTREASPGELNVSQTDGGRQSRSRSPLPPSHTATGSRQQGHFAGGGAVARAQPWSPPSASPSERSDRNSEGWRRCSSPPNGRSPEQLPEARARDSTRGAAQPMPSGSGHGGSTKLLSAAQIWGRKAAKQVVVQGEPLALAGKVVEQGKYATKPDGARAESPAESQVTQAYRPVV